MLTVEKSCQISNSWSYDIEDINPPSLRYVLPPVSYFYTVAISRTKILNKSIQVLVLLVVITNMIKDLS